MTPSPTPPSQQVSGQGNPVAGGDQHIGTVNNYFCAAPGQPSGPVWQPPPRANAFTGREEELREVAGLIDQFPRVALVGPGGMGKTALAAEVLFQLAPAPGPESRWPGGIFSHDFYRQSAHSDALAGLLGQAGVDLRTVTDATGEVRRLFSRPGVLLYLEGCEKATDLAALLDLTGQSCVLLTTRDKQQRGDAHAFEVHPLRIEDAAQLLHWHARQTILPGEAGVREPWLKLARELGGHPLALRLAGAWMGDQQESPAEFAASQQTTRFGDWAKRDERKDNLHRLFAHSAEAVMKKHPRALEAWFALALHGHAPIHLNALRGALRVEESELKSAIATLNAYSLARRADVAGEDPDRYEAAWELSHALLNEWAKLYEGGLTFYWKEHPNRRGEIGFHWATFWREKLHAITTKRLFPGGYNRYVALQPTFSRLAELCRKNRGHDVFWKISPMIDLGLVELLFSNFSKAEALFREESEASEANLGPHHDHTSVALHNLGVALCEQGKHREAEPFFLKSLEGKEKTVGKDSPLYLQTLKNIASVLHVQGRRMEAFALHMTIWEKRCQLLGNNHPETLLSAMSIATFVEEIEGDAPAFEVLRRLLGDFEREMGASRLETLQLSLVVAAREVKLGSVHEAEARVNRALGMLVPNFGEFHQQTLVARSIQASIHFARGQHELAQGILRQCRLALIQRYGYEDADTQRVSWELVKCLEELGQFSEAIEAIEEIKEAVASKLGPESEKVLQIQDRLGSALFNKGDFAGAEAIHRSTRAVRLRTKSEKSLYACISTHNLATALERQGKTEEAEAILLPALQVVRDLGDEGNALAISMEHAYASVLQRRGALSEAELQFRKTCELAKTRHGPQHFVSLAFHHDLALCLLQLGKFDEAESLMMSSLAGFEASLPENHRSRISAKHYVSEIRRQKSERG